MKFDTKHLLYNLNKLKPSISKNDMMEEGKSFIFTGKELITFNEEISIGVPMDSEFSCLIPADPFLKIISKIQSESVFIDYDEEKKEVKIKTKKTKATLKCLDMDLNKIVMGLRPDIDKDWKELPNNFMDGLILTVFSTAKDAVKPYLTCVNVSGSYIISSDNLRLSRYTLNKKVDEDILLPAGSAKELLKFQNIKEYKVYNSWIFFKSEDNIIFCSRIVDAEYPDTNKFFENEEDKFIDIPKDELRKSIEVVSVLAEGEFDFEKRIHVKIHNKMIECSSEKEIGNIKNTIPIDLEEDISFSINPDFFYQILQHSTKMLHRDSTILFKSDNFEHVIALYKE